MLQRHSHGWYSGCTSLATLAQLDNSSVQINYFQTLMDITQASNRVCEALHAKLNWQGQLSLHRLCQASIWFTMGRSSMPSCQCPIKLT